MNGKKMESNELLSVKIAADAGVKISVGPCDTKVCDVNFHGIPCNVPGAIHAACAAPRDPGCMVKACLEPVDPKARL